MAVTEKKNTIKYKFGQQELDMQKYLENIGYNVQSYLEDRIKNRGWTDDQVQEFSTAYNRLMGAFKQQLTDGNNRFSTNDLGVITDSQGEFSNTDDDDIDPVGSQYYYNDKGERITTDDYNLLKDKNKKKYKTFNANRQVAEYFRIIGNKLKDKPKPETSKFSLDKHGFVAWWNKKYNPAGEKPNLIPFLEKDPVGANGKRPVNNRAKMAAGWMNDYLDWLKDQDLDYSNYDQFKDYDTYAAKGKALAAKWGDGKWDSDDLIEGQAFGISNDFSEGFFTQDEKPYLTEQQREEIDSKRKEAEEQKKAEEEYKKEQQQEEQIKLARQKWVDDAARLFNSKYSGWYSQKKPSYLYFNRSQWYTNNGKINESKLFQSWGPDYLNQDGTLNSDKLSKYMNYFLTKPFHFRRDDIVRNILSLIYTGIAKPITQGKLKGMYYIPRQSDTQDYGALIYNPNGQQLFYSFIANVPEVWNELITQYLIQHENLNTNAEHYFKEGGIISLQYGGDFGIAFANKRNDYVKSKADATNTDVNTYNARSREPAGSKNALKPNNGFTANDILRLTAIGTDLAAMGLSFTPAVGAAALTGAAGTTQHLIADINEDGLDWGDVGRAALGYSLDALGIIPGTSAVTKPAKIIKTLKTFVPRLIAVVGTVGTVANAPAITKSLNKLKTDEHLTVQDWQNITSAVTLAVGGGAAAARKFHTVRGTARGLKSPAKTMNDNVAIQVRKKGTKDIETIILTKSETETARKAKSNEDLLKIIQKREGMSNYELATRSSLIPSLRRPTRNNKWPIHFGQTRPNLMPIKIDQKTGKIFAENGRWGADITRENLKNLSKGQHEAINQRLADDAEIANLDVIRDAQRASAEHQRLLDNKASIISARDTYLKNVKANRDAYIAAHPSVPSVTDTRRKLQDVADALAGHPGATIRKNPELTGYNAKIEAANRSLLRKKYRSINKQLTGLNKELAQLEQNLSKARGTRRTSIKKEIAAKKQEIANKISERARLKTDKQAAEDWLNRNNITEYNNLIQQLVKALQYERGLAPKNAAVADAQASLDEIKNITNTPGQTEAFKKLKDMMDPSSSTINFTIGPIGAQRTVTRNWKDILKKYNIKYKQGGKFTSVRKYETGKPITNVKGKVDWFTNMYSHQSMQKWINGFNTTNYQDFNLLQDSWYDNLKETGYDPNNPGQAKGKSDNVFSRQKEWNKTGTNAAIKNLIDSKLLTPAGNSGDNEQSGYQDGYFGAQEYLRHGGTRDSWQTHDKELQDLCEKFKQKGLEYYLDENGMYKLRLLNSDKPSENNKESSDMVPERDKKQQQNDQKNQFEQVRKFNIDPMVYSIAHNAYANASNDKMTTNQIDAMRKGLTLYDFKNNTKYLEGDFDALISGQQAAGQLMHLASQPLTSDGALQTSTYSDAVTRALDYIRQGNVAHNQALKKSKDEIWQLRYDDDAFNYNVAMNNRTSIGDLIDNIANVENTHDSKEFTNNDVLWQEMMTGIKQKANKREAMEEHFALLDIENDVKYNLSEYAKQSGKPLSKDEEEAWNAVISGNKTYSELGGEDKEAQKRLQKAYINALRKASEIEQDKNREYYGIPRSKYNSVRQIVTEDWYKEKPKSKKEGGTLTLKNGSKITIAKIKKRQKDIDNFYKTIKDTQDRIDKAIARVDKKMYKRRDPEKRRK